MPLKTTASKEDTAAISGFFAKISALSQLYTSLLTKALPDGVHPSHFAIIDHVYRTGEGHTPVQIATAQYVTKTTMSHSLKVLKDRDLIRIARNPKDGRAKQVFLTLKGRAFRDDALRQISKAFGQAFQPDHLATMARIQDDLETLRKF